MADGFTRPRESLEDLLDASEVCVCAPSPVKLFLVGPELPQGPCDFAHLGLEVVPILVDLHSCFARKPLVLYSPRQLSRFHKSAPYQKIVFKPFAFVDTGQWLFVMVLYFVFFSNHPTISIHKKMQVLVRGITQLLRERLE